MACPSRKERDPRLSYQAKTGPEAEQDVASSSLTEKELTSPARCGSGSEQDPSGLDPTGRHGVS